jgi:hypothetical protein
VIEAVKSAYWTVIRPKERAAERLRTIAIHGSAPSKRTASAVARARPSRVPAARRTRRRSVSSRSGRRTKRIVSGI